MAVGQNQWDPILGIGVPTILEPILVVGLVDVHWGCGLLILTRQMSRTDKLNMS